MRWGIIAALVLWCGVGLAQEPVVQAKNTSRKWTRPNIEFGVIFRRSMTQSYFSNRE